MKKSELYAAYKGKGPHAMYCDIMQDSLLRASAEIVTRVAQPLHLQYAQDLRAQQGSAQELLEWNAQRSLGASMLAASDILSTVTDPSLFTAMRLTPHCRPPVPFDNERSRVEFQDDFQLTEKAIAFSVELAANFAWSEQYHSLTLPMAAASLLAQSVEDQTLGLKHLKKLVSAIVMAEEAAKTKSQLHGVLTTLAFQEEPFARELMILLKKGRFRNDSDSVQDCKKVMTKFCKGSASTKEILESTFGHLAYCVAASNKNKQVAPHVLWNYTTGSPYIATSGMKQHIPNNQDWILAKAVFGNSSHEMMQKYNTAFLCSKTELPQAPDVQIPTTVAGIHKTKWRLAGPSSHYNSAAAAAYLIFDAPRDFCNVQQAWAGGFLSSFLMFSNCNV